MLAITLDDHRDEVAPARVSRDGRAFYSSVNFAMQSRFNAALELRNIDSPRSVVKLRALRVAETLSVVARLEARKAFFLTKEARVGSVQIPQAHLQRLRVHFAKPFCFRRVFQLRKLRAYRVNAQCFLRRLVNLHFSRERIVVNPSHATEGLRHKHFLCFCRVDSEFCAGYGHTYRYTEKLRLEIYFIKTQRFLKFIEKFI